MDQEAHYKIGSIVETDNLISFIIPHKGRSEMLNQTLQSIDEQEYPLDKIEVIVISQTPEIENTRLLPNSNLKIKIILLPESETISTLRNHGVKQSKGHYLAFLDADIYISANWISSMLAHLKYDKERVIMSGIQVCDASAPPLEHIRTCLNSAERDANMAFLPGCNLFLTRQTFEKIGGFPEHLIACEDYYFSDKATQFGKLYRTSDATYIHLGEDKRLPEMFKKEIWRGQSNFQSIRGRRITLREIPSLVVPLGSSLSLVAAITTLLYQNYTLTLLLLALGIGPTLAYSIRLIHLSKYTLGFGSVYKFYSTYFLARAIGILVGLFKAIDADHN